MHFVFGTSFTFSFLFISSINFFVSNSSWHPKVLHLNQEVHLPQSPDEGCPMDPAEERRLRHRCCGVSTGDQRRAWWWTSEMATWINAANDNFYSKSLFLLTADFILTTIWGLGVLTPQCLKTWSHTGRSGRWRRRKCRRELPNYKCNHSVSSRTS